MIDEKLEFFPDLLINFEMTNSNNIGSEFSSINDINLKINQSEKIFVEKLAA